MNDGFSIIVEPQTVYKMRNKGEWADITIKSGGTEGPRESSWVKVSIHSSYGNFGHYWCSIGPGHWSDFLNRLDIDYAMNKLYDGSTHEFDGEKSVARLKKEVLKLRRQFDLEKDEARKAWDLLVDDLMYPNDEGDFHYTLANSDIPLFSEDYWEWSMHSRKVTIEGFWERIWRPFVMHVANNEDLRKAA